MIRPVYIYVLEDPLTKEVRYVGKTLNPGSRIKGHLECIKNTPTTAWIKKLMSQGRNPVLEVIEVIVEDGNAWEEAERFWISTLRFLGCRLTNLDSGGNGSRQHAESTKKKMSESAKGRKTSPEVLARLSKIRRGRVLTKEHKAKISASLNKASWPEGFWEWRAAHNSALFKGKKLSEKHKAGLRKGWEHRRTLPIKDTTRKLYSECSKRRWRDFRDEQVLNFIQV